MASKSSPLSVLCALVALALLLIPNVHARPSSIGKSRLAPRADMTRPMTFSTKSTKTDSNGQVFTESCTITLTPIQVNGQSQVQEVSACVIAPGTNDPGPAPSPVAAAAGVSQSGTTVSTSAAAAASSAVQTTSAAAAVSSAESTVRSVASAVTSAVSAATSAAVSTAPTATSAAASAAATTASVPAAAFSIIGDSSTVRPSNTATGSSVAATGTAAADTAATTSAAEVNASSTSATSTASAAAVSVTPASTFNLPGKTISVLPIGLGVFAGISVIALVVVGLVTYERTKYRKAFRARKLAEAGGAMGYGGMAEARV